MSGVYIPGMKMPKPKLADMATVYHAYVLARPNGHAVIVVDDEDGLDSTAYPLIPVPDHGRLIDADALTGQMEHNLWAIEDKAERELGFDETLRRGMQYGHAVCLNAVNDAAVIIPASKEVKG